MGKVLSAVGGGLVGTLLGIGSKGPKPPKASAPPAPAPRTDTGAKVRIGTDNVRASGSTRSTSGARSTEDRSVLGGLGRGASGTLGL